MSSERNGESRVPPVWLNVPAPPRAAEHQVVSLGGGHNCEHAVAAEVERAVDALRRAAAPADVEPRGAEHAAAAEVVRPDAGQHCGAAVAHVQELPDRHGTRLWDTVPCPPSVPRRMVEATVTWPLNATDGPPAPLRLTVPSVPWKPTTKSPRLVRRPVGPDVPNMRTVLALRTWIETGTAAAGRRSRCPPSRR